MTSATFKSLYGNDTKAEGDTAESREVGLTEIENYQHAREI